MMTIKEMSELTGVSARALRYYDEIGLFHPNGRSEAGYRLYDEKELEDALEQNITRFLLELGSGFAFIGRQKEIIVAGKTRKIDMLFYHIKFVGNAQQHKFFPA